MSVSNWKVLMIAEGSLFSDVVEYVEEAFALLVFENYFDRWHYLAESKRMSLEDNGTTCPPLQDVPDVLYQKKVARRKDNVYTAGKWTDEGIERYNIILGEVEERRNCNDRKDFEKRLDEMFRENMGDDWIDRIEKKKIDNDKDKAESERRVRVMPRNTFKRRKMIR